MKRAQDREELLRDCKIEEHMYSPDRYRFTFEISMLVAEAMHGAGVLHRAVKTMVETIHDRHAQDNGVLLIQLACRYMTPTCEYNVKAQWALLFITTTYDQRAVAQAFDFLALPGMIDRMRNIWDDAGLEECEPAGDKYIERLRLIRPILNSFTMYTDADAGRTAEELLWVMTRGEYREDLSVMWKLDPVRRFALEYLGDYYRTQEALDLGC
jgi:hypothetical protein